MLSYSQELLTRILPKWADNEWALTNIFMLLSGLLDTAISLPFSLYRQFVLEEKHGFNKMTYGFYFKDLLKSTAVGWLMQGLITWPIIWAINKTGDYFVPVTWGISFSLIMVMMTIYPAFIAPLFDKYTPLPEGPLQEKLYALAEKVNFPLKKLFVVDGSNRSSHSNAYMYGFRNNKRIVLFDTLINNYELKDNVKNEKGCNDDEIVSILGHELGHWKMGHTWKNMAISQTIMFLYFYGYSFTKDNASLFSQFGFSSEVAPPSLLQLTFAIGMLGAPFNELVGCLMTMFSRYNEYQ